MKCICLAIGILFVVTFPGSGQQTNKSAIGVEKKTVEEQLRQLEREWDDASVRKDITALGRILSDDFILITASGTVKNKAQLIDSIKSTDLVVEPFETEDVMVRIYGDTAVLTGHFTQKGSYQGKSFSYQFRYTDVYVKMPQGWQGVSAQATLMKQP